MNLSTIYLHTQLGGYVRTNYRVGEHGVTAIEAADLGALVEFGAARYLVPWSSVRYAEVARPMPAPVVVEPSTIAPQATKRGRPRREQ